VVPSPLSMLLWEERGEGTARRDERSRSAAMVASCVSTVQLREREQPFLETLRMLANPDGGPSAF